MNTWTYNLNMTKNIISGLLFESFPSSSEDLWPTIKYDYVENYNLIKRYWLKYVFFLFNKQGNALYSTFHIQDIFMYVDEFGKFWGLRGLTDLHRTNIIHICSLAAINRFWGNPTSFCGRRKIGWRRKVSNVSPNSFHSGSIGGEPAGKVLLSGQTGDNK